MRCVVLFIFSITLLQHVAYAQDSAYVWSLNDIFSSDRYRMKTLASVKWVDEGRSISYFKPDTADGSRDLVVYDITTGDQRTVIDGSSLRAEGDSAQFSMSTYTWSPDSRSLLLTGSLVARRTKSGGSFALYDVPTGRLRVMTDTDEPQANIRFSPDGSRIGFVRSNNLFVMDAESGEEVQLTTDGSETILNGEFDWVYEEEFSVIGAWEWSPDGRRIAFWRIDQSAVPTYPIVRYPMDDPHPTIETMRYPKPGDSLSSVKIGVVDVDSARTTWVDLGSRSEFYVPRIQWTNDPDYLTVQWLNRGQDTLDLLLADVRNGSTTVLLTETDPRWLDVENGRIDFLKDSDRFIWTSFRDGWHHLYLYRMDGTLERQLTSGEWEVTEYLGVDERRKVVYFAATEESPLERHLYSVRLDGRQLRRLTNEPGWHSLSLAPNRLTILDTWSDASNPPTTVLRSNTGEEIARLVENSMDMFQGLPFGDLRFLSVPGADGLQLKAWMLTPPDFDPARKYPVLFYVYGGPGSQTVMNRWGGSRYLWYQLLCERGYIVFSVDNRGTGARGKEFMQMQDLRLGIPEVDDYRAAAIYLKSLSYVDSTRLGIWGWSGGGSMTCLAMTYGAGTFRTGIAVAPVTDWHLYDAVYTERYMDTPAGNPEGYEITSSLHYAEKLTGNLLIIHGLADDNVHWQNTVLLVEEFIRKNRKVSTMFYPERRHGLGGRNGTLHVYTLMTDYLLKNL